MDSDRKRKHRRIGNNSRWTNTGPEYVFVLLLYEAKHSRSVFCLRHPAEEAVGSYTRRHSVLTAPPGR